MVMTSKISRKVENVLKLEEQLRTSVQDLLSLIATGEKVDQTVAPVEVKTWGPGVPIPESVKENVKTLLREGIKPAEIHSRLKVSMPMIHKIKGEIGMVKRRGFISA
jgi:hypothetical protein